MHGVVEGNINIVVQMVMFQFHEEYRSREDVNVGCWCFILNFHATMKGINVF